MADFYALPTLNEWRYTTSTTTANQAFRTGWSNTSGGPNIAPTAALPTVNDRVFFDANSGPSRTITISSPMTLAEISTVGSAPMIFQSNGTTYSIWIDKSLNLTGTTSVLGLYLYVGYNRPTSGTVTFIPVRVQDVYIQNFRIYWYCTVETDVTADIFYVEPAPVIDDGAGGSYYIPYSATFRNKNVTARSIELQGAGGVSLYMGTGTWTLNTGYSMLLYCPGTVYSQGCTIVVDATTSFTQGWYFTTAVPGDYNLWIKRTVGTFQFAVSSYYPRLSWRIDPGCTVSIPSGAYSCKNFSWRGNLSSRVTVTCPSGSATLTIASGGPDRITFDFCNITRINGSPANTFYGRQCNLVSSNIIPYFAAPGFAAFF